jgi:hypothetical protein
VTVVLAVAVVAAARRQRLAAEQEHQIAGRPEPRRRCFAQLAVLRQQRLELGLLPVERRRRGCELLHLGGAGAIFLISDVVASLLLRRHHEDAVPVGEQLPVEIAQAFLQQLGALRVGIQQIERIADERRQIFGLHPAGDGLIVGVVGRHFLDDRVDVFGLDRLEAVLLERFRQRLELAGGRLLQARQEALEIGVQQRLEILQRRMQLVLQPDRHGFGRIVAQTQIKLDARNAGVVVGQVGLVRMPGDALDGALIERQVGLGDRGRGLALEGPGQLLLQLFEREAAMERILFAVAVPAGHRVHQVGGAARRQIEISEAVDEAEHAAAVGIERGEHRLAARHRAQRQAGQRGETARGGNVRFGPVLIENLVLAAVLVILARRRGVGRQRDRCLSGRQRVVEHVAQHDPRHARGAAVLDDEAADQPAVRRGRKQQAAVRLVAGLGQRVGQRPVQMDAGLQRLRRRTHQAAVHVGAEERLIGTALVGEHRVRAGEERGRVMGVLLVDREGQQIDRDDQCSAHRFAPAPWPFCWSKLTFTTPLIISRANSADVNSLMPCLKVVFSTLRTLAAAPAICSVC